MNSSLDRKVPIRWDILRERVGKCDYCGTRNQFKKWLQIAYPFPVINCPECMHPLYMGGAVKDYFKEQR